MVDAVVWEVYVSSWHRLSIVLFLAITASAPAQETRVVLDRGGATIVLEPYAPNIVRVTLSKLKEPALAAPGYGVTATPSQLHVGDAWQSTLTPILRELGRLVRARQRDPVASQPVRHA